KSLTLILSALSFCSREVIVSVLVFVKFGLSLGRLFFFGACRTIKTVDIIAVNARKNSKAETNSIFFCRWVNFIIVLFLLYMLFIFTCQENVCYINRLFA